MKKRNIMNLEELRAAADEPFKCAVFSGGGAKGAIYSGVHEAMVQSGVLAGLDAVAGSSAGAITAVAIATGISCEDFHRISQETNFKELLGEGFLINKDGKPLYKLMQDIVSKNVTDYLKYTDVLEVCDLRIQAIQNEMNELVTNDSSKERIETLKAQQSTLQSVIDSGGQQLADINKRVQENDTVTFQDLNLLHVVDPIKFKDLVITATNRETGELTIFDARKTPDIEIALACRASASIPLVFEPVTINGVQYVDGGYRDNIPLSHFQGGEQQQDDEIRDISNSPDQVKSAKKQGRTLALAFGSDSIDDTANVAIYSAREKIYDPGAIVKFLMDVVFKVLSGVGGKFAYSAEENKMYEGLRENALNTVVLDTKDVSTLSFEAAQEKAEYLHIKGYIQTSRHFDNHFIGENQDKNLPRKEFMLKVYEETQERGMIAKWQDKILGRQDKKARELLSFCKSEPWEGQSSDQMIESFIVVAATGRADGKLTSNIATMNKIVAILNDPQTPNLIKEDFIKVLQLDIKENPGFKQDKSRSQNIVGFKFKTSDFDGFLAEKQRVQEKNNKTTHAHTSKKEISGRTSQGRQVPEKGNITKEILQQKKAKTMRERVDQEPKDLPQNNKR